MRKLMRGIKNLFFIVVIICLFFYPGMNESFAQSFPEQMHFSEDGSRLILGGITSEGVYDESVVREIRLDFYNLGFWEQMHENYDTEEYVLASLSYEGEVFDSVAVQFKGQTSYTKAVENGSEKLSFSLKLDEVIDGQDIDGYNNFNLNNAFGDESFMKEVLYARLSRNHLPAVSANFIRLYLNGEDWGLYANVQQLNGDFIKDWYSENDGIRWRADVPADQENTTTQLKGSLERPPGGGANWGDGTAALNYLGDQEALYQQYYTLKDSDMDDPWEYLVAVCERLNNLPEESLADSLGKYMDLDGTMWFLAQEILFSDDDSYVMKGKMDYYLFLDKQTGRMIPLEFDGNSAMQLKNVEWSPFYNEEEPNYPLMNRLLAVPELRQRYIAHVKTMLEKSFDPVYTNEIINGYSTLVKSEVETDPKIDFTISAHSRVVNALKSFIAQRRSFILSNSELTGESPSIAEAGHQADGGIGKTPDSSNEVIVSARATHSNGIEAVNLYYGTGLRGFFVSVPMRDDGTGDDELAGDAVFSARIPAFPAGTYVRYYVEAVAGNAANTVSYMPEGASYDVYFYRVEAVDSEISGLVINEFMASNELIQADEAGEFDDWIELYNRSGNELLLEGFHLSDDAGMLSKWTFPAIKMLPDEYQIIWADEDGEQGDLHANFKLSAGGEEILLTDADGHIVDYVVFADQDRDISFGRWPDGTGSFSSMMASFQAENQLGVMNVQAGQSGKEFQVYPNPARDLIRIVSTDPDPEDLMIFNALGQMVYRGEFEENFDISSFVSGIYLVKSGSHTLMLKVN